MIRFDEMSELITNSRCFGCRSTVNCFYHYGLRGCSEVSDKCWTMGNVFSKERGLTVFWFVAGAYTAYLLFNHWKYRNCVRQGGYDQSSTNIINMLYSNGLNLVDRNLGHRYANYIGDIPIYYTPAQLDAILNPIIAGYANEDYPNSSDFAFASSIVHKNAYRFGRVEKVFEDLAKSFKRNQRNLTNKRWKIWIMRSDPGYLHYHNRFLNFRMQRSIDMNADIEQFDPANAARIAMRIKYQK